jgi:hypothetical protein
MKELCISKRNKYKTTWKKESTVWITKNWNKKTSVIVETYQ